MIHNTKQVITFNLSDHFIVKLADYIEENYFNRSLDLSKLAFVFGGKRPALFFKKELAARIGKSFIPPRFFSMDEFIDFVLLKSGPFKGLIDLDAAFTVFNLAKEIAPGILKGRENFSQFLPWAREIVSFIDQLDLEDINKASLKNIESKAEIGFDIPENINRLLEDIISIRKAYQGVMRKSKAYSRGLRYLSSADKIEETDFSEFEQILFCGFFYLHKTEEKIISSLYKSKKASLVFQGSRQEWSVLNKLSQRMGINIQPDEPIETKAEISIQRGFDAHSQACLAREELKVVKDLKNTLIVLPNPNNVITLLSEISSQAKDFNISLGYPLKRSSLYSLFSRVFEAQKNKKGAAYYSKDYLKVLAHPLVKNLKIFANPSVTRVLAHKIEEVVLGIEESDLGGSLFLRLEDIEKSRDLIELAMRTIKNIGLEVSFNELKDAVSLMHKLLFKDWEGVSNFYEFSLSLQELLSVLIEKGIFGNYPLNLKMAEKMFAVIEELSNASFNRQPFPQGDIFKIFENKIGREMVSFSGSPLKGLQILGLFEARSLNFENVIFMDVNESVLPSLKIYEPLIPREVMISLGINRLEKEEEIQRYQFRRLIASAKKVLLIYQESPDKEKSRFIEEIIWEKQKKLKSLDVGGIPKANFQLKVLPKRLRILKKPEILDFLKSREYSASSINTYLNCPLKFYYQYALGLKEKEGLLDEPEGKDIGNFIHELLEEQFVRFIHKKPLIDNKFREEFFAGLDEKFSREFARKAKSDAFMIKEVMVFWMERFLDNEKKRGVQEIVCLEKVFEKEIKLGCGDFKFKAIVDRIDSLSDGSLLILDYKTGSAAGIMPETDIGKIESAGFSREALKKTVKSFQLPLYLHILAQEPKYTQVSFNAALYFIKEIGKDSGLNLLLKKKEDFLRRDELMRVYLLGLGSILEELLDPKVPFQADDHDPFQCQNCPFFYLCR